MTFDRQSPPDNALLRSNTQEDLLAKGSRALLTAHGVTPDWKGGHGKLTAACRKSLRTVDLHFHDLRHEAGSRWLEGGLPIHHVKELLRHANIKTTDTYLNATRLGLRESLRKYEESRKFCTNGVERG